MGHVWLFEPPRFLVGQRNLERADRLIQLLHLRGADDWRRDGGLTQQPGERDLRRRDAARRGDFDDAIGDIVVGVVVVEIVRGRIALLPRSRPARLAALAVPPPEAARGRAPPHHPDALPPPRRDPLPLLFPLD